MKRWLRRMKKRKVKKRKVARDERSMLKLQIFVGVAIGVVIGGVLTAVYFGSRVASMQITEIDVVGGYTIPHSEIEKVVETELGGTYFGLVPKTFTWTYPRRGIANMLDGIPRLKQTEIVLSGQALTVAFEEYQPVALWCSSSEEVCLFLDQAGYAFAQAPALVGSAFVRYSEAGKETEVKSVMVERDFLTIASRFAERLSDELGLYVTHVHVVDELDVTYRVSGGGEIKVARGMDVDDTFSNLQTILQSEDFAHLDTGSFAYIDLRFGDKVFVNEVGEVTQEETTSSSEKAE